MTACPACDHVNVEDAQNCAACGSPLVLRCPSCRTINARTRTRCHYCAARLIAEPTQSMALDDTPSDQPAAEPVPPAPPASPTAPVRPAMPAWNLTLRADRMPVPPRQKRAVPAPAPARTPAPEPVPKDVPKLSPTAPDHADTQPQTHWGDVGGDLSERKAEARAAVRRARQRHQRRTVLEASAATDVLLLEPDEEARSRLCALLHQFGFKAHAVGRVDDAEKMLGNVHFVAAFVGVGPKNGDAADFCRRLRAAHGTDQRLHALVAMIDGDRHADRVRVELAGADAVLTRPVMRGQVAQALEECGVALPQDPRAR